MKIPKKVVETVEAVAVEVHAKVSDAGSYTLLGPNGEKLAEIDGYVPKFFPEQHYGDYLIFRISLETGQIMNWEKPTPEDVATAFEMIEREE